MQATAYFLERENVRSLLDPVDEVTIFHLFVGF